MENFGKIYFLYSTWYYMTFSFVYALGNNQYIITDVESFLHTNIHNYILLLENRHLNFEIISYGKCTVKKFYITIMQYTMCKVCKNNSHFLLNTSCPLKHQQTKMTYNTMQGAKFCITITSHLLPDPVLQNTESESRCIPIWVHFFRIGFQEIRTWTELGAFSRVHNRTDVK